MEGSTDAEWLQLADHNGSGADMGVGAQRRGGTGKRTATGAGTQHDGLQGTAKDLDGPAADIDRQALKDAVDASKEALVSAKAKAKQALEDGLAEVTLGCFRVDCCSDD